MALSVVGFSGSIYGGAAAIKSPLFRDGDRFFSGDPSSPPATTYDRAQIEEYQQRGLVSLLSIEHEHVSGYVVLYAHELFLSPPDGPSLKPLLGRLAPDDKLGAYYAYIHREDAARLMREWAEALLTRTAEYFAQRRLDMAEETAMRARFAATTEHAKLRKAAFSYIAASRLVRKRRGEVRQEDVDAVLQAAAVDFSEEDTSKIRKAANKLAERAKTVTAASHARGYTAIFAAAA